MVSESKLANCDWLALVCPCVIQGNFMDIGMHRVVSKDDAIFTLQHLDRCVCVCCKKVSPMTLPFSQA